MKKGKNIVILVGIIIAILILICLYYTNTITFNNKNNYEKKSNNTINIIGEYELKSETESPYHSSTVKISNKTDNTIDFKIETVHGLDIEHVNIGSISNKANKITETIYKFNEEESEITFKFSHNKLTISEKYKDNINPYGGHGVYFTGEYKKKSQ